VPDENEQEKIASNTGIATDAIQQANPSHKAKLVIYCKPEDNVDIESLRNEVEQLLFTEHE
jgi:hypothetical protein